MARNIFEDTECLDTVVRRIMTHAQDLIACQRCTVYITDKIKSDESEDVSLFLIFTKSIDCIICRLHKMQKFLFNSIQTYIIHLFLILELNCIFKCF